MISFKRKKKTFPILLQKRDLCLQKGDQGKTEHTSFGAKLYIRCSGLRNLRLSPPSLPVFCIVRPLMTVFVQLPAAAATADSFGLVISAEDGERD